MDPAAGRRRPLLCAFVALLSVLIVSGCGSSATVAKAPAQPGPLAVGHPHETGSAALSSGHPAGASGPLSIKVSGNHFVNGSGATVRLLGVDVPSTEYACEQGWGYAAEPLTTATAAPIAAWEANAVRIPLNEDCWLGINNQPAYGMAGGYQSAIEAWVNALNSEGVYAILDLHWTAPGTNVADGQRPMPDDHSVAFWTSVATTFKANRAVLFDVFNEPYSPAGNGNSALPVSWSCWDEGGCPVPAANQNGTINDSDRYNAVGMQSLVTAIRGAGASQPILLGGLSYANDLTGWLANEPTDPDHQLVASFHAYYGNRCDDITCWNSQVATVAAQVPVVTGEFDQGYDCTSAPAVPSADAAYDTTFMDWADSQGVSYLAWGWWVLPAGTGPCGGGGGDTYDLISNLGGTPISPDGTALHTHLATLAAQPTPTTLPAGPGIAPAVGAIPWTAVAGCHLLPRAKSETALSWLARSGCLAHSLP